MKVPFVKMQGCGNDFVIIEDLESSLDISSDQAERICDRHFGVGADGIILVRPDPRGDSIAFMHYMNADGSLAQMCGNGIRCFAKYLVDNRLVLPDENEFTVSTLAGPRTIKVERDESGHMTLATVDMGEPSFLPESLPTTFNPTRTLEVYGDIIADLPIATPDGILEFTCLSMGNPHAVTFLEDDPGKYIPRTGPFLESSEHFPEKTNVEFARVIEDGSDRYIQMRVYERGDGETLACGTGCCATVVAAAVTGRAPRKITVKVLGGALDIDWRDDNHVYMTGPAETSFEGIIDVPGFDEE